MTQLYEIDQPVSTQVEHEQHDGHPVGDIALMGTNAEVPIIHAPLPEGYFYDAATDVADKGEVAALMTEAGLLNASTKSELETADTWYEKFGIRKLGIGVRTPESLLVGYGLLLYKDGVGEMGDLVVLPSHRGNGIGKAIIDTRIQSADALGIKSLFIEGLQNTNTLRDYYEERGFHELPGGNLGRGENPKRIEL